MKKAMPAKKETIAKKPATKPAPAPIAPTPLMGSFGGKTEDQ
jgi:hypothetical protein